MQDKFFIFTINLPKIDQDFCWRLQVFSILSSRIVTSGRFCQCRCYPDVRQFLVLPTPSPSLWLLCYFFLRVVLCPALLPISSMFWLVHVENLCLSVRIRVLSLSFLSFYLLFIVLLLLLCWLSRPVLCSTVAVSRHAYLVPSL